MIEIICEVTEAGAVPINEEEWEKLKVFQLGQVVKVKFTKMRNPAFFKKWWALVKFAFDYWSETNEMPEYKGQTVQPNFKRFRKDMVILAGHFTTVVDVNLNVHLEADSLKWGKMDEATFNQLYSSTINAILKRVYNNKGMTEEKLRRIVDDIMAFV